MPGKINIVLDSNTLQEFRSRIQEVVSKYVQMLKQPTQIEDRLLIEDVPMIEIEPKSITGNPEKKEEKRPKNIGTFTNLAKDKEPIIVENGGRL